MRFKVTDVNQAREVARFFGIPTPEGRGKFPLKQLTEKLDSMGYELDTSEYVASSELAPADPVYAVSALIAGSDERGDYVTPATAEIHLSRVREVTGKYGRGRVSLSDVITAVVTDLGWRIPDVKSVKVQ